MRAAEEVYGGCVYRLQARQKRDMSRGAIGTAGSTRPRGARDGLHRWRGDLRSLMEIPHFPYDSGEQTTGMAVRRRLAFSGKATDAGAWEEPCETPDMLRGMIQARP